MDDRQKSAKAIGEGCGHVVQLLNEVVYALATV
jgi:hypothetical protein